MQIIFKFLPGCGSDLRPWTFGWFLSAFKGCDKLELSTRQPGGSEPPQPLELRDERRKSMEKVKAPFLFVNPKSYLWGKDSLALAKAADKAAEEFGVQVFFTCPYADLRLIAENTTHVIVTAQNMDALRPGRGMGAVLPESVAAAGAKAVVLNHAENQKTLAELSACMQRARELDLITIVCADSVAEAKAVAQLGADVILAEPTALIGSGTTADDSYTVDAVAAVRSVDPEVKVMIASGITTPEDCYKVVYLGADGTGSTSGIVKAPDPAQRVYRMVEAIVRAARDREKA